MEDPCSLSDGILFGFFCLSLVIIGDFTSLTVPLGDSKSFNFKCG